MASKNSYSASEMMAFRAAKEIGSGDVIFVGIGLPNLACNLAKETHAPGIHLIYEAGAVGAVPERLPISIGDPALVTGALSICSQADIFQCYLQRGLIEIGFLGGAQIDRYGNINTTVIGDYANPKVRLPGSGGACEIATHAKKLLVVMRLNEKSFVEECDFVTSPGHVFHNNKRDGKRQPGAGPQRVITDLCVMDFVENEMCVTEIYPGVSKEDIQNKCGWNLKFSDRISQALEPDDISLSLLRDKLDPDKLYL